MKTLARIRECISESIKLNIPRGYLEIPRFQMPQIELKDYPEFFRLLALRKISVVRIKILARELHIAQTEINLSKIREWMKSMPKGAKDKPCLISSDLYILDGNHTALSLMNRNPESKVDCFVIGLEMEELLQTVRLFDRITYKLSNE